MAGEPPFDPEEAEALPTVDEVLRLDREDFPQWLGDAGEFDEQTVNDFLSSRVVYYPGAGTDGRALAMFGHTHSAHCFVHIDLSTSAEEVLMMLQPGAREAVNGYSPLHHRVLGERQLVELLDLDMNHPFDQDPQLQPGLWVILQRDEQLNDQHGPKRLALFHVQAEAVWFCGNMWGRSSAFAVLLQNHADGTMKIRFGGRSELFNLTEELMDKTKYLLVGHNTRPWPGYEAVSRKTSRGSCENQLFRRRLDREPD